MIFISLLLFQKGWSLHQFKAYFIISWFVCSASNTVSSKMSWCTSQVHFADMQMHQTLHNFMSWRHIDNCTVSCTGLPPVNGWAAIRALGRCPGWSLEWTPDLGLQYSSYAMQFSGVDRVSSNTLGSLGGQLLDIGCNTLLTGHNTNTHSGHWTILLAQWKGTAWTRCNATSTYGFCSFDTIIIIIIIISSTNYSLWPTLSNL